ncbi:zinc ribbon domain-containing protein [Intestinibacter sp.]
MKSNNKTTNYKFVNRESRTKKSQIEKEIHSFEDKKSEKIMELGILVYDKVRRGLIDESIFGKVIYEIKKIDLEIYNRMLDIANMEGHDEHTPICECGYISKNNEKFCPNCGREIKKDREFILCDVCASKIDSDSKFCVCCGSKIIKKQNNDLYEDDDDKYVIDDDFDNDKRNDDIIKIKDITDDFKFDKDITKIELNKKEGLNKESISDKIYIEPELNEN